MTNREYALLAGKTLSAKKAQDIVIIDIQGKASFADFFVICSGTSERQINTLVDDVEEAFAKEGLLGKVGRGQTELRLDFNGFWRYHRQSVYQGNERKIQYRKNLGRL